MRGSEFARLRAFITIVDEGNFARAAAQLRVSPSTLSQTIRELEESLGVRLLNRTTRSVAMTQAGERLLARFKPALAEMTAAVDDIRSLRETPAGMIRLQTPRTASVMLIEPLLGRFFESYPDITIDITIDDAPTDFVEAGYDICLRLGELLEQDMVAVKLGGDIRQIAVASPAYLARFGRPTTPADLHAHRCINWRWPGSKGLYNWEFADNGRWFSVAVNGPLTVSHRDTAVNAALQDVGIAFWSEHWLRPFIADGRLVPLLEDFSPTFPGWYVCYPRQRHTPAAVRAFVDFLRREVPAG